MAIVQSLVPSRLATDSEAVAELPVSLRAHALIALGKMCLQDEKLAKRYRSPCVGWFPYHHVCVFSVCVSE